MDVTAQQCSHKMFTTSWWKKWLPVLLSKCSWFRAKNIDQSCTSYKFWKNIFDRKLIFFLRRKVYISLIWKKRQNKYVTLLIFILYSIWVNVESLNYKMSCLKSAKSSEVAIFSTNSGQEALTMFISSFLTTVHMIFKK